MNCLPKSMIPDELKQKARELGRQWASSAFRPRLSPAATRHWDALIRAWADSDLPLVVRRSSCVRGEEVVHASGRRVVSSDNSPAQWVFSRAFAPSLPSFSEVQQILERDGVPFTMVAKACDRARMRYKCTLASADNVNKRGWKLCHIIPVGLKSATPLQDVPIDGLKNHFLHLLMPSNHFLVPLKWAGLGELDEVIEEIVEFEKLRASLAS